MEEKNEYNNIENNDSSVNESGYNSNLNENNEVGRQKDADSDFNLDPDLSEIETTDELYQNSSDFKSSSEENASAPRNEDPFNVEPIAPIMPEIHQSPYKPIEKNSNNGMRVFAIILAALVVISASVTGGYFVGVNKKSGSVKKVDLASKPSPENAKSTTQIFSEVDPSIVGIEVYNSSGITANATGVIYSEDGYVVTNDHIYLGAGEAKFKVFTNDNKMYDADFIAGDTRSDLAVLKIKNATGLKKATFGNSDELAVGESVIAVGRPNGAEMNTTVSEGIISALNRRAVITSNYSGKYIQTDTAINPGSSGGALCNLYGQIVGITSAKLVGTSYEGMGFAIPTTTMKSIVESLIANKRVVGRAKLGISYVEINRLTAEQKNVPCGLQIGNIDKNSGLYGKSVKVGDIITHMDGKEITSSETVLNAIEQSKPGDSISLTVYLVSTKKSVDISVKLLEDEGGSSYNSSSSDQDNATNDFSSDDDNSDNSDSSKKYNSSQFDFPNGN